MNYKEKLIKENPPIGWVIWSLLFYTAIAKSLAEASSAVSTLIKLTL